MAAGQDVVADLAPSSEVTEDGGVAGPCHVSVWMLAELLPAPSVVGIAVGARRRLPEFRIVHVAVSVARE